MWKSSLKLFRNEHFKVWLCNKALIMIDLKLLKSTQTLTRSPLSGEKLPVATNIGKRWIHFSTHIDLKVWYDSLWESLMLYIYVCTNYTQHGLSLCYTSMFAQTTPYMDCHYVIHLCLHKPHPTWIVIMLYICVCTNYILHGLSLCYTSVFAQKHNWRGLN